MRTIEYSLGEIDLAVRYLLDNYGDIKIWLLEGEMGSGKTTFVKCICRNLWVQDTVSSPTYNIVHEYIGVEGALIYHFDLYRVKDILELDKLGYHEYLVNGDICLIEWGGKYEYPYPRDTLTIKIRNGKDKNRILEIYE